VLADELLVELRPVVGRADLAYAEAPTVLTGGFFTENHAFRLADVSSPWSGSMVVRLFPPVVSDDAVRREAVVQRQLAAAGFPTPPVTHFDPQARLDGRRYFVMERMAGKPLMGGIRAGTLLRDGPGLLRRLARITADQQADLHAIDPAPVVDALAGTPATVERWFEHLERLIDRGGVGFAAGLDWLIANRPVERGRPVVCHGDLHPGNILVDGDGAVTAVLDWTVATIAEPSLDVGFTTMALLLAPVDAPRPVQRIMAQGGRAIARSYVRSYVARTGADVAARPYYEALRCAVELGNAASYRLAVADGRGDHQPRPTWDSIADAMVRYFRARSGVELTMPAPVSG
jgi:aminoglycoside phosphotransferase (APT) family kinase protein